MSFRKKELPEVRQQGNECILFADECGSRDFLDGLSGIDRDRVERADYEWCGDE